MTVRKVCKGPRISLTHGGITLVTPPVVWSALFQEDFSIPDKPALPWALLSFHEFCQDKVAAQYLSPENVPWPPMDSRQE